MTTVDALARRTVADAEQVANIRVLVGRAVDDLWQDLIDEEGFRFSKEFLSQEWEQVILARNIKTRDEYFAAPRPGAAYAFRDAIVPRCGGRSRHSRQLSSGPASGPSYNLPRLPQAISMPPSSNPTTTCSVDEAQDLHPAQWRLLRAAVAPGKNDLFIAGDAHQRIYDNRVSLSGLGIETRGRSTRLRVNYRTTHEILRWSLELLAGQTFDDLDDGEDSLEGYRSVTHGGGPVVSGHATHREELDALAEQVRAWQNDGINLDEIGICARTKQTAEVAEQHLRQTGLLPTEPHGAIRGPARRNDARDERPRIPRRGDARHRRNVGPTARRRRRSKRGSRASRARPTTRTVPALRGSDASARSAGCVLDREAILVVSRRRHRVRPAFKQPDSTMLGDYKAMGRGGDRRVLATPPCQCFEGLVKPDRDNRSGSWPAKCSGCPERFVRETRKTSLGQPPRLLRLACGGCRVRDNATRSGVRDAPRPMRIGIPLDGRSPGESAAGRGRGRARRGGPTLVTSSPSTSSNSVPASSAAVSESCRSLTGEAISETVRLG